MFFRALGADAVTELDAEGFDDVIVRAGSQAFNDLPLVVPGRQQDDFHNFVDTDFAPWSNDLHQ